MDKRKIPHYQDLSGQKFGRLTAMNYCGKNIWLWQCECGNMKKIRAAAVKNGHTRSCGCLEKENLNRIKYSKKTHGLGKTKAYKTWCHIKTRCYNPNDSVYSWYGEKGIGLQPSWINDPEAFCNYVMSLENYDKKGFSIDRIDYEKGYEEGNLRWVDSFTQQNNKSNNHSITYNGQTLNLTQWSRKLGISQSTLSKRFQRGWSVEESFEIPSNSTNRYKRNAPIASTEATIDSGGTE
jgi:hypothetical protein